MADLRSLPVSSITRPDVWHRWAWLWFGFFYLSLVVALLFMVVEARGRLQPIVVPLGMSLLLAGWQGVGMYWFARARSAQEWRTSRNGIFCLVTILGWFYLLHWNSAFYWLLGPLYAQAFAFVRTRWAILLLFVLTTLTIVYQLESTPLAEIFLRMDSWFVVGFTIGAPFLAFWIEGLIEQSRERRHLIEALHQTQATLRETSEARGRLEERQRLARDIHDTVAQGLVSVIMHLEAADQALPPDQQTVRHHLQQASTAARTNLVQARQVVQDLRPDLIETADTIADTLRHLSESWSTATCIPITVTVTDTPPPLSPLIMDTLLRVTREALANIQKHARASAVQITLSATHDEVLLDIQDDGLGIDAPSNRPTSAMSGKMGLKLMRERLETVQGTLEIESSPYEGTTLSVSVPCGVDVL